MPAGFVYSQKDAAQSGAFFSLLRLGFGVLQSALQRVQLTAQLIQSPGQLREIDLYFAQLSGYIAGGGIKGGHDITERKQEEQFRENVERIIQHDGLHNLAGTSGT